ncbi:nonsense-mediated mRNA decay factor SMG9-like isoform X1 [Cloeon dipterum]|uniref:nonsense-mediated mRNA decay factor SMG9-like isoform X1 n=1 Tax=Cloeon dipterum TaxID=197152 RepID=UPI003220962C
MEGEKYREKHKFVKKSYKGKQHPIKEVEMKQPTILVREHTLSESSGTDGSHSKPAPTPAPKQSTVILKSREHQETRSISPNINLAKDDEKTNNSTAATHQPVYQIATKAPNNSSSAASSEGQLQAPPLMLAPVKILDECLQVCDSALEYLMDQNDYLVVGAIGPQGCGKSHILSELAGSPGIFRSDGQNYHAGGSHCTVGVDMYVTPARVIFLDTQPIFSASVMECMASMNEKKFASEASVAENTAEISDLHLIAFLLSVCHVVIYVDDWLLNLDAVRYIRDAEMLKLSPSMFLNELATEYFPTLVIVKNNAAAEDFKPETRAKVQALINRCFRGSKLKIDSRSNYNFGRANCPDQEPSSVFLLPMNSSKNQELNFHGYVSYKNLISSLCQQIQSVPRQNITPVSISERHWYHHACKVIENIKKGSLFMEYSRLLT